MNTITRASILFMWMHTLTYVKSQDCTLEQFINGPQYDGNLDTNTMETSYPAGKKVTVGCKVGYWGSFQLICVEGNWWSSGNKCELIGCTVTLPPVEGTTYEPAYKSVFHPGETLRVICSRRRRFFRKQDTTLDTTCKDDGKWSITPVCKGRQCEKTAIEDAYITHDARDRYEHNNKVQYACFRNRNIKFEAICDDGKWSGNKSCSDCQTPEIPNGYAVGPFTNKTYYSCNEGYKLFSKGWWGEATCNNLQWTGLGKCIEMNQCGEIPEILNGNMAVQDKVYQQDSSIKIICNEGYKAEVEDLNCEDGNWTAGGVSLQEICKPHVNLILQFFCLHSGTIM